MDSIGVSVGIGSRVIGSVTGLSGRARTRSPPPVVPPPPPVLPPVVPGLEHAARIAEAEGSRTAAPIDVRRNSRRLIRGRRSNGCAIAPHLRLRFVRPYKGVSSIGTAVPATQSPS